MGYVVAVAMWVLLDLAAVRFGTDTRTSDDWRDPSA
jgi:hypothetical protein